MGASLTVGGFCIGLCLSATFALAQAETLGMRRPPAYSGRVLQDNSTDPAAVALRSGKVVPVSTATQVAPPTDPHEPLFRELPPTEAGDSAGAHAGAAAGPDAVRKVRRADAEGHTAPASARKTTRLKESPTAKRLSQRGAGRQAVGTTRAKAGARLAVAKPRSKQPGLKPRVTAASSAKADSPRVAKGRAQREGKASAARLAKSAKGAVTPPAVGTGAEAAHRLQARHKGVTGQRPSRAAKARGPRETAGAKQPGAMREKRAADGPARKLAGAKPQPARRPKTAPASRPSVLPARRTVVRHAGGPTPGAAGLHLRG